MIWRMKYIDGVVCSIRCSGANLNVKFVFVVLILCLSLSF